MIRILKLRGRVNDLSGHRFLVIPPPSTLLRSPKSTVAPNDKVS
jgi:hypothetical protein